MKNFKDQVQVMIDLIKKSSTKETTLEDLKKTAQSDKINQNPSNVGRVLK